MPNVLYLLGRTFKRGCGIDWSPQSIIEPRWRKSSLTDPTSAYACSCFFYSLAGAFAIIMTTQCPLAFPSEWPAGWAQVEAALIILQGFWSFGSDVHALGRTSYLHPIDRTSATWLTGLQFFKYGILLRPVLSTGELVWLSATLLIAIAIKLADYQAIAVLKDRQLYERTHFWWHVSLPFGVGGHLAYRWLTCPMCIGPSE